MRKGRYPDDGLFRLVTDNTKRIDRVLTKYEDNVSASFNNYEIGCLGEALIGYSISLRGLVETEKDQRLRDDLLEKKEHIDLLYDKVSELYRDECAEE